MYLKADLHIHSVLSPCGGLDMSPAAIVKKALERGMDIIALADHNSAGNLRALEDAARDKIALFFGLEIQSASETHLLALFGNRQRAEALGDFLTAPWSAIWPHPLALSLRERKDVPRACKTCDFFTECGGGCPLAREHQNPQPIYRDLVLRRS